MNWYKKAQFELWQKSEKDYAGYFNKDYYDTLSPEEQDIYWRDLNNKRREWEQSIQRAISTGLISPEQAKQKGWIGTSISNISQIQPLPQTLYHVTTNKNAILKEGLKSRRELKQNFGRGLGGGDDETISFTADINIAYSIYNALIEGKKASTGELSVEDMMKKAIEGESANKPWIDLIVNYYGKGRKTPKEIIDYFSGDYEYSDLALPSTVEEYNRHHKSNTQWEGIKSDHWPDLREGYYVKFRRKRTPAERIEYRFDFFKSWSFFREGVGGPMTPLFFLSDPVFLSQTPDDQISILEFRAKPNSYGYKVSALGEWRTWSGETVELIGELK